MTYALLMVEKNIAHNDLPPEWHTAAVMFHWFAAIVALVFAITAHAAPQVQPAAPPKPTDVTVGVYVVQLDAPNLKESKFTAVFWLWFRWQGDKALNPLKKFEVVGGQIESIENEETLLSDKPDGIHYQAAKVRVTVTQGFDLMDFPLDRHTLNLAIEETDEGIDHIRYIPDAKNSKLQESIALDGWALGKTKAASSVQTYASTFGDPRVADDASSAYTRYTISIPISRPGVGYPLKLFWSLYLSVFIVLLAFKIKPSEVEPRFGLGIGAVFAIMASSYVISSALPDGNQVTLADKVVMICISFIFLSIVQSIISLHLLHAGKATVSSTLDKLSFIIFNLCFIGINFYYLCVAWI